MIKYFFFSLKSLFLLFILNLPAYKQFKKVLVALLMKSMILKQVYLFIPL